MANNSAVRWTEGQYLLTICTTLEAVEQVQLWERRWWLMCCNSDLGDSTGL